MNKEKFIKTVTDFAQISEKSKIIFPEVEHLTLANIPQGILFVFSGWSGPSVHAWKALTRALSLGCNLDVALYVIDADELPSKFVDEELKSIPQGNGETFWINHGKILHRLSKFGDEHTQDIQKFTAEVHKK